MNYVNHSGANFLKHSSCSARARAADLECDPLPAVTRENPERWKVELCVTGRGIAVGVFCEQFLRTSLTMDEYSEPPVRVTILPTTLGRTKLDVTRWWNDRYCVKRVSAVVTGMIDGRGLLGLAHTDYSH